MVDKHPKRVSKNGKRIGRPPTPARERFWAKVVPGDVPDYAPELGQCLIWTGARTTYPTGQYGRFRDADSRMTPAHRWAYVERYGPTDAQAMDHLCRVTLCVNPEHLEPVTDRENILRSPTAPPSVNARKTHCPRGHAYDAVYRYNGSRYCSACRREQTRESAMRWYWKQRERELRKSPSRGETPSPRYRQASR